MTLRRTLRRLARRDPYPERYWVGVIVVSAILTVMAIPVHQSREWRSPTAQHNLPNATDSIIYTIYTTTAGTGPNLTCIAH